MRFIQEATIVKQMREQIQDDSDTDKLLHDGEFPRNPVTLTEVDEKFKSTPVTKFANLPDEPKDMKLCFSAVSYEPQDVRECV